MTDTAFRRAWDSYLLHLSRAAGREISIRPHDLRITYCTMLKNAGVDMKQAMIWMGHADEKMILRVYDRPGEYRAKTSVNQVEKMLIGMQNGMQTEQNPSESLEI
jgi:integrase